MIEVLLVAAILGDVEADFAKLPQAPKVALDMSTCWAMRNYLDLIETVAAPWDEEAIACQREELSRFIAVGYAIHCARKENGLIGQRQSLNEVRRLVGDEIWFSGDWPPLFPWWRIPR